MHLMEDLKLMIKLLLVALTDASVVLTASLLYGLVNCSAVTYRKTLSKFGWRRFDHVKFSVKEPIDVEIANLIAWIMDGRDGSNTATPSSAAFGKRAAERSSIFKWTATDPTLNFYYSTLIYRYSNNLTHNLRHIETLTIKCTMPFWSEGKKYLLIFVMHIF